MIIICYRINYCQKTTVVVNRKTWSQSKSRRDSVLKVKFKWMTPVGMWNEIIVYKWPKWVG